MTDLQPIFRKNDSPSELLAGVAAPLQTSVSRFNMLKWHIFDYIPPKFHPSVSLELLPKQPICLHYPHGSARNDYILFGQK